MNDAPPREKLKHRMLDVTQRLLEDEGLAAVQARRIAAETSCSVGTLYNVFKGGLDDLIIEANDRTLQRLGEMLAAMVAGSATSVETRLMAMALGYLRFAIEHQRAWRALFEHRMAEDQSVPDWYRDNQAALFAQVEGVLAELPISEADRRRTARALFSAVHGIVSLALDRKLGAFDPVETEAQVRLIVAAVTRGLQAPVRPALEPHAAGGGTVS